MSKDKLVGRVIDKFQYRSEVGLRKYGKTMSRKDLSELEWLKHFQEELMDATLYCQRLIEDRESQTDVTVLGDK